MASNKMFVAPLRVIYASDFQWLMKTLHFKMESSLVQLIARR